MDKHSLYMKKQIPLAKKITILRRTTKWMRSKSGNTAQCVLFFCRVVRRPFRFCVYSHTRGLPGEGPDGTGRLDTESTGNDKMEKGRWQRKQSKKANNMSFVRKTIIYIQLVYFLAFGVFRLCCTKLKPSETPENKHGDTGHSKEENKVPGQSDLRKHSVNYERFP